MKAVGQILLESYAAWNPDCKHLTIPLAFAYQDIMFRSHERLTVRGTPAGSDTAYRHRRSDGT